MDRPREGLQIGRRQSKDGLCKDHGDPGKAACAHQAAEERDIHGVGQPDNRDHRGIRPVKEQDASPPEKLEQGHEILGEHGPDPPPKPEAVYLVDQVELVAEPVQAPEQPVECREGDKGGAARSKQDPAVS